MKFSNRSEVNESWKISYSRYPLIPIASKILYRLERGLFCVTRQITPLGHYPHGLFRVRLVAANLLTTISWLVEYWEAILYNHSARRLRFCLGLILSIFLWPRSNCLTHRWTVGTETSISHSLNSQSSISSRYMVGFAISSSAMASRAATWIFRGRKGFEAGGALCTPNLSMLRR